MRMGWRANFKITGLELSVPTIHTGAGTGAYKSPGLQQPVIQSIGLCDEAAMHIQRNFAGNLSSAEFVERAQDLFFTLAL